MPRTRMLKPEFFDDEDVAKLSFAARLLFQGLWVWADRRGVVEDRPTRLKARIFPFDDVDMDVLLRELERGRFVVRYGNGEHACLHIRTFQRHQNPHPKEPVSDLPGPSDSGVFLQSRGKTRRAANVRGSAVTKHGEFLLSGISSSTSNSDSSGCSSGGSMEALTRSMPPTPPEPAGPVALRFPTVGVQHSWALAEAQVSAWAELFPGLDVRAECQHALAWLLAAPGRKKTARGMPKFLVAWLGRSNDRTRPGGASVVPLTREQVRSQRNAASVEAVLQSFRDEEAG